jgi:hypothetical protein
LARIVADDNAGDYLVEIVVNGRTINEKLKA